MIFRTGRRLCAAAVLALLSALPGRSASAEVTVFAAASLKSALDDIAAQYSAETGNGVTLSYAGTSALARQIRFGAPADIFVAASADWMDLLEAEGLIRSGTRFDLVSNRLVLIAHGSDAAPFGIAPDMPLAAVLGEGRLAMALVDAVPAGLYGKAALASLGVWDAVAPKVAQTDNVRAALALVASGEAPFGVVYATDAAASAGVSIVGVFPETSHPPIVYPAAGVAGGDAAAAAAFLAFLNDDAAQETFARHGFRPAGG